MENQRHDESIDKMTVEDLRVYYRDFEAIKGVSMGIKANRVTALIGPSGCGKSTFLRTLNRMNDLIEGVRITGSIKLDGVDIYAPGPRRRRPAQAGGHGLSAPQSLPQVHL